ncbi:MAG: hypothetical protein JNK83_12110 [Rhizobiales bacterium]|nr:hypothetical protein [Hyphomicrobiales bacterium]
MNTKAIAAFSALMLFSSSAVAQEACDPAKLSAMVDTYAGNPFSARTWRVLNGLGDPMIEPSYSGSDTWQNQDAWKKLVAAILPPGQAVDEVGYDCRIGYPLEVLQSRIATLGKDNPYVQQWLKVQGKVLQVCSNPDTIDVALPEPIEPDPAHPTMQAEDRAYQEATIFFYKDKPKAIELFRAIAATASPHKAAARYNIANLLANSKDVAAARAEANAILADPALASVHNITQELLGYIANLEDTPAGWSALIDDSIKVIETPAKDILASDKLKADYARALNDIDYAGIRGKREDWWLSGTLPENPTISKAILDASRQHSMALWMMAGQSLQENYDAAPWSLVGDKWQQRAASYLDQVMAVMPSGAKIPVLSLDVLNSLRAKPDDATREALWGKVHGSYDAAQKSCGAAPETAALGIYLAQAVRVSAATGHFDQAYDELGKLPLQSSSFYQYNVVQKLGQYLVGQGMAAEGRKMRDRLLTPAFMSAIPASMNPGVTDGNSNFMGWVAEDADNWKAALSLNSQKTISPILNFLPAKTLWALADEPMFSADQKALLTRVAWTRGYARGGTPSATETEKLYAANPKLRESADKIAAEFPKLRPERQRLLTILRNPRMGILVNAPELWSSLENVDDWSGVTSGDHNDRNWWCPLETDRQLAALRADLHASAGMVDSDDFSYRGLTAVYDQKLRDSLTGKMDRLLKQHPMIKAVNWKEVGALANMPSAPRLLSQSAIRWGKASKGDDGAPEALALAVKTTRYGCNWHGRHRAYSETAQQLLRSKFGSTAWAAQTPYWFDCQRMEWDKDYNKVAVCAAKTWPKQALPR